MSEQQRDPRAQHAQEEHDLDSEHLANVHQLLVLPPCLHISP